MTATDATAAPLDFLALVKSVEQQYRSYLTTSFYFRDECLRASFARALDTGEALAKGPYIEAIPSFVKAGTVGELFREQLGAVPDPGLVAALGAQRQLYTHQREAVQKVDGGRNVVVATGTGSGKTEAFLYPILLHLYREQLAGAREAGVRALILYPMNALANDQLERLRGIARALQEQGSRFSFTFGQYIGETPESAKARRAAEKLSGRAPGELVTREEMRATPPDILLTNYSMLEYLLIRPDDSELFDGQRGQHWAFLVLDEAHQYRGAKGIEMALLLRRLKQRVRAGGRGTQPIRCIATSATLGRGAQDAPNVAQFATNLFGEAFEAEDVVLPQRHEPDFPEPKEPPPVDRYAELESALETGGITPREVYDLLIIDPRVTGLLRRVRAQPTLVSDLAADLFAECADDDRGAAVSALIRLLVRARDANGDPALLARLHLFLRAIEGAFICFEPQIEVSLNRTGPAADGSMRKWFEAALCRECGQHFLVGRKQLRETPRALREPVRDPSSPDFGVDFYRPVEHDEADDEDVVGDEGQLPRFVLCVRCAAMAPIDTTLSPGANCDHAATIVIERQEESGSRHDRAKTCSACGNTSRDPIAEVVHGNDAPHAVIATTLYRELEEGHRKVLAFADSRQNAAFFAWYLDETYRSLFERNLIYQTALRIPPAHQPASLRDIAQDLRAPMKELGAIAASASSRDQAMATWRVVLTEFLSDQRRLALDGLGLLAWDIKFPDAFPTPEVLTSPPWSLSEAEARDVVFALLESLRVQRAVDLNVEQGLSITWDDLRLRAAERATKIGSPKGTRDLIAWDGPRTSRVDLLQRFYARRHRGGTLSRDEACDMLRSIWQTVQDYDADQNDPRDKLLREAKVGWRLNPAWWRARVPDVVYRCDSCLRIQAREVGGVCLRKGCNGTVAPHGIAALEPNHYRSLAQARLPGPLRVEEHTAQLDAPRAREFQQRFQRGEIDVLSCSTTFELGVDLGDLDAVLLRNVPPEAFNYQQRIGRAARRDRPGFCVTYCSRSPHDLFYFAEPIRIISGEAPVPTLRLANAWIAERHVAAVALSAFFRAARERFSNVQALFGGDVANPDLRETFEAFVRHGEGELTATLRAILPEELEDDFGLDQQPPAWRARISRPVEVDGDGQRVGSRLALAIDEYSRDYEQIAEFERRSATDGNYTDAEWAQGRRRTLEQSDVLSFLSRKTVIPKYGFPVDVVELDTSLADNATGVELDRDLAMAISEFAPGASLVANKRLWTSYALKRVPEREWEVREYAACARCGLFEWRSGTETPRTATCHCGRIQQQKLVVPEFGFTISRREGGRTPQGRPERMYTSRAFAVAMPGAGSKVQAHTPFVKLSYGHGELALVCEGRQRNGFRICRECGAQTSAGGSAPRSARGVTGKKAGYHFTPFGSRCDGTPMTVMLGHHFKTDVVRLDFINQRPIEDQDAFAWSLGYALVEGLAAAAGCPASDLGTTIAFDDRTPIRPIVLYDSVPGGAGIVSLLQRADYLHETVRQALARVRGDCGCADESSCYGCLRNYRNQFVHERLQRGAVRRYLEALV
jgi:ATP-dependent helicase YprA (DUF1998 family)